MSRIVVVGLGPGDARWCTAATLEAIAATDVRFLRTRIHPSADLVADAVDFDYLYEDADGFDEVYRRIHTELATAARLHGEVLYAVPGSPLILEHSVRLLLDDPELEVVTVPAMSFLDLAYDRLGIDPIESGVRLIDGHRFAVEAAGDRGPLLVAHVHADWVLSEIKLSIDDPDDAIGDTEVIALQRLGTSEERIITTTWAEMDRVIEADHLTTVYLPELSTPVGAEYVRFHQLARILRERCGWDIEQTHQSLRQHLIEETYEVIDAIDALDPDDPTTDEHLIEELGDLLYQVEFHATIAEQQGRFTIADVARGIHDKLVRRHPHVFGPDATDTTDIEALAEQWESIKAAEKLARTGLDATAPSALDGTAPSALDGVPLSLPSLSLARKIQSKAARVGFDWPDARSALPKIAEEADELVAAIEAGERYGVDSIEAEVGDLLFAVVNIARHLGIEPEVALRSTTLRFIDRFTEMEHLAAAEQLGSLDALDAAALEALYQRAKANLAQR